MNNSIIKTKIETPFALCPRVWCPKQGYRFGKAVQFYSFFFIFCQVWYT